jgi:hypothetical protein
MVYCGRAKRDGRGVRRGPRVRGGKSHNGRMRGAPPFVGDINDQKYEDDCGAYYNAIQVFCALAREPVSGLAAQRFRRGSAYIVGKARNERRASNARPQAA